MAQLQRRLEESGMLAMMQQALDLRSQSSSGSRPALVKPDGSPLISPDPIQFKRLASKRSGSMKKWIPTRLNRSTADMDRETIVERAVDLAQNDPNAASVVDSFATTIVGSGLMPHPILDAEMLGISEEQATTIENQQRNIFNIWSPFADAAQKMNFGQIQFLAQRMIVEYGEYLFIAPMISDPTRPYMLALQAINPLRLKTPSDLANRDNIKDGVEIGLRGEPVAYWIKKSNSNLRRYAETSANFTRISTRAGHRWKVFHGFPVMEPEQFRGVPFFSSAMKFFKDLGDFLDAELVANVITAAFALFIETGNVNPVTAAGKMAVITETGYKDDGTQYDERYEEVIPGTVMYGQEGQKPHSISAERPGRTFDPFTRLILRTIANSVNIPYPVLFKDFEGMNYASYRSAMLEAWRVFRSRRKWLGEKLCQPVWSMLMEEAYLRNRLKVKAFYRNMFDYTCCEWIGPPKGQIEPIKEVSADVLAIKHGLKSREETMLEQGREFNRTMAQIQKEQKTINDKGIVFESGSNGDGGDDLPGTTVGRQMLIPFEADAEFESEMES